jgi:hypothetical protein
MKIYNLIRATSCGNDRPLVETMTSMSYSVIMDKFYEFAETVGKDSVTVIVEEFDMDTAESVSLHYFAGNEKDL